MGNVLSWQSIAAGAAVLLAIGYLVWKLGLEGRGGKRKKRGPDVPTGRLVRKKK